MDMTEKRNQENSKKQAADPAQRDPVRVQARRRRMRKKQLTRLAIYALLAVLAVLLVLALVALVKKIRKDRVEKAEEIALQEEIDHSTFYDAGDVLHLSFPVLTLENEDGAPRSGGLSVSEFKAVLEDLYNRGYVLIDFYSLSEQTADGYAPARVMVPEGKKPLILSQHDVSYSSANDGRPDAMIRTSAGDILCSYVNSDGETVNGEVDVVPILESFLAQHADFSYKGARGILGVTGYQGLLGHQIVKDENIITEVAIEEAGGDADGAEDAEGSEDEGADAQAEAVDNASATELIGATAKQEEPEAEESTSSDEAKDDAAAKEGKTESDRIISENKTEIEAILGTLRSDGWHIAGNSYGLVSYGSAYDVMSEDARDWSEIIGPIVGTTDILLLPGGADLGSWSGYNEEDPRLTLLQELGFRHFCVENAGAKTWIQIRPGYVRQGMHTIDTYQTYTTLSETL